MTFRLERECLCNRSKQQQQVDFEEKKVIFNYLSSNEMTYFPSSIIKMKVSSVSWSRVIHTSFVLHSIKDLFSRVPTVSQYLFEIRRIFVTFVPSLSLVLSNDHYVDMSLSSMLHRSSLFDGEGWYGERVWSYICVYIFNTRRRRKRLDTDVILSRWEWHVYSMMMVIIVA